MYPGGSGGEEPGFQNEKAYAGTRFPRCRLPALLSLYRYWNIIQYLSPYKHLIKVSD